MMSTISAVINTRNEETNIRYCLESVKWCDEIIVVDMESEDRTVAIAREYTDKIYSHPKVLAFDIARRFAVEKASCDWILLIDADELVPKELSIELRNISRKDDTDAVMTPYKNFLLGAWNKYTGWWPDYHCRFFRKEMMNFSEQIHNFLHLDKSARKAFLPAEEQYAIHHFAYRDAFQFIDKMNRYTTIEAAQLQQKNNKFSNIKMIAAASCTFVRRYIFMKGYKDGPRGLFVSIMLAMYRMLTFIKLWEAQEYSPAGIHAQYIEMKKELVNRYHD
jgi:glycosyltransferase involved in cell wall biosynthesis